MTSREEKLMAEIMKQWEALKDIKYTIDQMSANVAFGTLCSLVDSECEKRGLTLDQWYSMHKSIREGTLNGEFNNGQ